MRRVLFATIVVVTVAVFVLAMFATQVETLYSDDTVVVSAGPAFRNATLELVVIDERGRPVEFTAFLSGPTAEGFKEIGVVKGRGRGAIPVGRYIAEAARYAQKLGWKPDEISFGILAFITTIQQTKEGTYTLTDVVTIPINPGKTDGKTITARIIYRPKIIHKHDNHTTQSQAAIKPQVSQPPPTIYAGCSPCLCVWWQLETSIPYTSTKVPLAITYLDGYTYNRDIYMVLHSHEITLSESTSPVVSFAMSLSYSGISIAPGPGVSFDVKNVRSRTLFSLDCRFMKQGRGDSICQYFYSFDVNVPEFGDSAVIATGIYADVHVVQYDLAEWTCTSGYRVLGSAWGIWMAPYADTNGRFVPWYDVSKAGEGELWKIFQQIREKAYRKSLPTAFTRYYGVSAASLYTYSSSSRYFSIAIPVGAVIVATRVLPPHIALIISGLAIGLDIASGTTQTLAYFAKLQYDVDRYVTFYPVYYEYRSYLVTREDRYYNVPIVVVWP